MSGNLTVDALLWGDGSTYQTRDAVCEANLMTCITSFDIAGSTQRDCTTYSHSTYFRALCR